MPKPSRARRIPKWTGAGLSLLVVLAWILSIWCDAQYRATDHTILILSGGWIGAVVSSLATAPGNGITDSSLNWHSRPAFRFEGPWNTFHLSGGPSSGNSVEGLGASLWFLLLLIALPTAWLWHRDRRRIRPGCCRRCGYNLTGNTSGVCSECGAPTPPTHTPPPASV